ncbi:TPR domain-containing protein [Fusarium oxysporum f. sp. albedinis]|nr:TPR domain-containing protein [Fusarium oxysporum f. sp. albedinis]
MASKNTLVSECRHSVDGGRCGCGRPEAENIRKCFSTSRHTLSVAPSLSGTKWPTVFAWHAIILAGFFNVQRVVGAPSSFATLRVLGTLVHRREDNCLLSRSVIVIHNRHQVSS